jgi:6-pyruvoyltetrahydropterin/6-carboxytetrahydropterin synthase
MFTILCRVEFHASHFLPGYDGDCHQLHGHNFVAEAEVPGEQLDSNGMAIDFRRVKSALHEVLPDHQHLNDWMDETPSTENLAKAVYWKLIEAGIPVSALTIWETARSGVRYTPPEHSIALAVPRSQAPIHSAQLQIPDARTRKFQHNAVLN